MRDYLDQLASGDPTPGGGSAAAVALGMAAALGSMVCRISARKAESETEAALQAMLDRFERYRADAAALADADEAAFARFTAANRLPRHTDQERAERDQARAAAALEAARVPLTTGRLAYELLTALPDLAPLARAVVMSDVLVAAELGRAALAASVINIRVNLDYVPAEARDRFSMAALDLEQAVAALPALPNR